MNDDKKPDLISGSYTPGDIYWFKAGAQGFEEGQKIPETTPSSIERAASAASCADWDGDGDLDILVGNIAGEVYWLENEGNKAQFKFGSRRALSVAGAPLKVGGGDAHPVAVDWDGDSVLDLLVGCGDGSVLFCKGTPSQSGRAPTLLTKTPLKAGGQPIALGHRVKLFVCDWNEDGQLDLLAGNFNFKEPREYIGNVYVMLRQP
ncbi:MAG: VCBS repeat-containing protein [Abditibacteriales bacterium]|nr:VCBS repeat-containing protein [Abditibacteriales bacterium]